MSIPTFVTRVVRAEQTRYGGLVFKGDDGALTLTKALDTDIEFAELYLLGWESLAEREQKWTAFQADPEWHKARDDSEKDGLLIANIKSAFLRPTPFSAIR